jgi:hypothetical protein
MYTLAPVASAREGTPGIKYTHRIRGWIDPNLRQHASQRKKERKKERKRKKEKERKKSLAPTENRNKIGRFRSFYRLRRPSGRVEV